MTLTNPKTTIFGTLAALGVWSHESGILAGTKWAQPASILTAGCLALAAFYAKDKHADDFKKTTEEVETTTKTVMEEKL